MRIDLIFPAYPPFPDAIGEYMAWLAAALRQEGVAARAICPREQSVAGGVLKTGGSEGFLDRANVIKGFSLRRPEELVETFRSDPPAVAVLQYEPFAWGVRGWFPGLNTGLAPTRPEVSGGRSGDNVSRTLDFERVMEGAPHEGVPEAGSDRYCSRLALSLFQLRSLVPNA
jgi:hypothetical protein